MKLKEVIKACGDLLSLELAASYFDNDVAPANNSFVDKLVTCFEQVYEELYRDYAAALRKTVVEAVNGVIDLKGFRLCRVISLVDEEGVSVPFRYSDDALLARDGKYNLTYARLPDPVGWNDELVMPSPRIGERVLVYGVAREYLASINDWATARQWDERFKNALQAASGKTASMRLPVRGWL